jgi:hypothetical protein
MFRLKNRIFNEFIWLIIVVFLFSIALFSVRAATITGASDTMTRSRVGTASNHTIIFLTASGAPESSTITVAFPASFNTVGMTEDDVDLFDNGLPLTTSTDCFGTEQASAVWTGNTLSFLICPGNGGAFLPGSTVTILIGTNAINSGVGVNRVINPLVAGSYNIMIGGTFGDTGFAPVAITADDEVGVTACVGAVCNVAPPPPPAPPANVALTGGSTGPNQTPPPQISNLTINQITASTARVSWTTDVASDSHVLFGLTPDYGAITGDDVKTQDHSVVLIGLGSDITYHVMARSVGYFGDVGLSNDRTFSTLSSVNQILPQISNIRLESVSGDEATVSWDTNVPTYWEVDFGRTINYGNEVSDSKFDLAHEATLGNLSPDTNYHFRIVAIDENGNQALSTDQAFTTFDTIPPIISDIAVENITPFSADIVWSTDKPATGGVQYGPSAAYENGEVLESIGFTTVHRVTLNDLDSETIYHYDIYQTDRFLNDAQSGDRIFRTAELPSPPVTRGVPVPTQVPNNATAVGGSQYLLTVNGVPEGIAANKAVATPGSVIGIGLSDGFVKKTANNITVQAGGELYKMNSESNGSYWVYFQAPLTPGEIPITAMINYKDGSTVYSLWNLQIVPPGIVYETRQNQNIPVAGVRVTVIENGIPWDGSQFGQNGTQTTDLHGNYSFFLPKGEYSLELAKKGYSTLFTKVKVYDGPVNDRLQLVRLVFNQRNIGKKVFILAKYSINRPECVFPWLLLLIIISYIIYRFIKRKKDNASNTDGKNKATLNKNS